MRSALRHLFNTVTALAVVMLGMVVLSSPASAHQGSITVASASCQTANGTYQVTYRLSWSNVPSGVSARIYSRTDDNTSFDSGWTYPGGKTWSDRGTTSGASGSVSWTQTLPGSTKTGPWEYAYLAWSNGYDGARFHDTRAEKLGGDCVQTTVLAADFALCHATGSATTVEGVKSWVRNSPSDSGQASGHVGLGHQGGLDIIPPIPVVLPNGQNWTVYGQQVHANGCAIPTYVDVTVTFADQRCTPAHAFVAPSFTAPSYSGLSRVVSGLGANSAADPGETVTVTYTGTRSTIITGAAANSVTFTHAFPTQPSGLRDCVPQPAAETRTVARSEPSCALGGVTSWVDRYTTPYVWSDARQAWVPGQETGPVRTDETFAGYGDQQYFGVCAPAKPAADVRSVPMSSPSCDPAGVTAWDDVYTTEYVWSAGQRAWVVGQETGPVRANETFIAYDDDAYFDECADEQPRAETRAVPMSSSSCDPAGVTSWDDVYTTEYVWSAGQRAWVVGQETGPVRANETFIAYDDDAYFDECADEQPRAETRAVPMSSSSCDPAGVTSWDDVYTTEYVWSAGQRAWVLDQETGPVRSGVTFAPYTDQEYFAECAPAQPAADERRVPQTEPSCALGGVTSWTDVYTTERVWSAGQRAWVLGQETGPVREDETFDAYTDVEYFDACADERPQAETRSVAQHDPSCYPAGVTSWNDVYTTEYVWDEGQHVWVLGQETGPVRSGVTFAPYTDEEYFEACAEGQPAAEQRRVEQGVPSCELGGVTRWTDVYTTEYVWNAEARAWELGEESGPVRADERFTAYTDEEYFEACAEGQPAAEQRRVEQGVPSCELGGVTRWTDVYTTEYVWNAEARAWELGEESGPVRADEQFTAYTVDEYRDLCAPAQPQPLVIEVAGAQASCKIRGSLTWVDVYTTEYVWNAQTSAWELGEPSGPVRSEETFVAYTDDELAELCTEVEGEEPPTDHEIENPGTPAVPTVVDAGLVLHDVPSGGARHSLWLLAVSGGLGLMGAAGLRRRPTATR